MTTGASGATGLYVFQNLKGKIKLQNIDDNFTLLIEALKFANQSAERMYIGATGP